jgi:hypothetical protein
MVSLQTMMVNLMTIVVNKLTSNTNRFSELTQHIYFYIAAATLSNEVLYLLL